MNLLENLKSEKSNLFQFYIVVGDSEKNKKTVENFLKDEFDFSFRENFFSMTGSDFLIDQARELKKENSTSVSGKKIIFLDFKKINLETQNALLKTFEEPVKNSHIFLFVPEDKFLLDTIKSRGRILEGKKKIDFEEAKIFFEGSFLEREKIIEKLERENLSEFLDSLEFLILNSGKVDREFYKKFLELKKYIFDKGVGVKNILTFIAIEL